MGILNFSKDLLMKKVPVYTLLALLVIWTSLLVGCSWIPTDYTTNDEQKNLTRQNTLLQIELYRRYKLMSDEKRDQFLIENVKFAIGMEEIICGEIKDSNKLFQATLKSK